MVFLETADGIRLAGRYPHGKALLEWYDRHRRVLPWRVPAGARADPYRVWLSEIMLQQTTVQAVAAYYRKFIQRWPDVHALAAAPLDEVLAAWAGLGYYARARNLHKCAQVVARERGGRFPGAAAELKTLPGIGAYTAGAIAAIAFDAREAAMDANAERVVARLFAIKEPLPVCKPQLLEKGRSLVPEKRAGDFVQAMMDLGATICTVKRPACGNCPLAKGCEASAMGIAEALPVKVPKAERPLKRGVAFVAVNGEGAVLLRKRPEKGLLAGMLEPPLGPWSERFPSRKDALAQAPFPAEWKKRPGIVRHTFTHFELEVEVWVAAFPPPRAGEVDHRKAVRRKWAPHNAPPSASLSLSTSPVNGGGKEVWILPKDFADVALPTVMKKIIAQALADEGPLFQQRKTPRP